MQDILGKFVSLFLAVCVLFIYPIMNMYEQQDLTNKQYVQIQTTNFVDRIRHLGYITPQMYQEYRQFLNATNLIYNVKIEHSHRKYAPVFTDVLDASTYQDDYNLYYTPYFTDEILAVLYPNSGSGTPYELAVGDYILVEVVNESKTKGTKIKELFLGVNLPNKSMYIRYGGMINNEAD